MRRMGGERVEAENLPIAIGDKIPSPAEPLDEEIFSQRHGGLVVS